MNRKNYYQNIKEPIEILHYFTTETIDNPFHFHDNYEVNIFLSGDADIYVEQSCYHLKRGHLFIFNDKEIHKCTHYGKEPYDRLIIHFNPGLAYGLSVDKMNLLSCFQNREIGTNNAVLLTESQIRELCDIFGKFEYYYKAASYGREVLMQAYLSILLVFVNKAFAENENIQPLTSQNSILSILSYINENLCKEMTLDSIAKDFSIDRYYLCHLFKKQTGTTLYQYILMKKITVAQQHLLEGRTVTEACLLSGFNDYTNFIRSFKNVTGISPGKYKSQKLKTP